MNDITRDFLAEVKGNLDRREEEQGLRPVVEVWPDEDGFGRWVAYHEAKERAVICSTPEYEGSPFCGTGSH